MLTYSHVNRRSFLGVGTAGLLGLSLPSVLRAESRGPGTGRAKADGAILVWLGGGPATIDMWDLKPDAPEEYRGEFNPVDTKAPGVRICEHLPKVAGIMNRCALVRSLHHTITDHGAGAAYMATGHPPSAALRHPALGAISAKLLTTGAGIPSNVTLNRGAGFPGDAGFLGAACTPYDAEVGDRGARAGVAGLPDGFTAEHLADRDRLRGSFDKKFRDLDAADAPAGLDQFQRQAVEILRSDRVRNAFDLTAEPETVRSAYGASSLGRCALTARRLIEAGTRFVTIGLGGWDTHAGAFRTLRQQLLPDLDRALAALVTDLHERGALDRTLVYCAGEFGRTPRVNGGGGRDHWPRSMSVLLAGGGVRGGCVHGSTDAYGLAPEADPCSPADVSATVVSLLGLSPNHEVRTPSGRPVVLFREGKVLDALIG
ncbi:DUF1501 domain-containing protein [Frigoriglobus tundricola]|uniref:Uncharacterized DUF1501 protein, type 2 n=1 Tax=Frigoriglobus tundricola TaxID=2774151 RepID=A0A6M5Z6G6_9BACT|nr:DUF1501 domain-containing protein [Frigoriglobus tundricola]QJX01004.1 Uncharacterized DUF1501 protein, type 2 [Frigoriglobus tundricola]